MKMLIMTLALSWLIALPAHAEGVISAKQSKVMKQLLASYASKAKSDSTDARGKLVKAWTQPFSAEAGREFYLKRHTWQVSEHTCSGCHSENPAREGRHVDTREAIKPLAPAANPERFTDARKVEKKFTEHCMDLHERDCYAYEKGNFIAYLMSLK